MGDQKDSEPKRRKRKRRRRRRKRKRGEREKGREKGWLENKDYNHTQLTRGGEEEKERGEGEKGRREGKETTTITPNSLVKEDAWLLYSLKSGLLSNSS